MSTDQKYKRPKDAMRIDTLFSRDDYPIWIDRLVFSSFAMSGAMMAEGNIYLMLNEIRTDPEYIDSVMMYN